MAQKPPHKPKDDGAFDVVCTIGTVYFDDRAEGISAHEAAFNLIAKHDAEGTYSFPTPSGGLCEVNVRYVSPNP